MLPPTATPLSISCMCCVGVGCQYQLFFLYRQWAFNSRAGLFVSFVVIRQRRTIFQQINSVRTEL